MKILPPGADVVPVPAPVEDDPPLDRFCDLVMTGGVASGVVYPWAVVELARAYRFRSIGGTSVGAMAAALAAAAEYGRRNNLPNSFEPLRRLPASLGEQLGDGRTRMLSLFQPTAAGKRLFDLFVLYVRKQYPEDGDGSPAGEGKTSGKRRSLTYTRIAAKTLQSYLFEVVLAIAVTALVLALPLFVSLACSLLVGALCLLLAAAFAVVLFGAAGGLGASAWIAKSILVALPLLFSAAWGAVVVGFGTFVSIAAASVVIGGVAGLAVGLWRDVRRGIVFNGFGLCKGGDMEGPDDGGEERPGITTWLHKGIQMSAGLPEDRPLTFRDLWSAPIAPGEPPLRAPDDATPRDRSINLELLTTNVSLGRPFRLPLVGETTKLYFRLPELEGYFPAAVLRHLGNCAPYVPENGVPDGKGYLELPAADMPVVMAARLSLSFPLLFSAVPLYAIQPGDKSTAPYMRRCWFSDGGISSNFPIHLFDAAIPRWPTFGMWLGTRNSNPKKEAVWLPEKYDEGGQSFWVGTGIDGFGPAPNGPFGQLFDFLAGAITTAKDWSDVATMRLPHMRCRIARLGLRENEGALNIAMPRAQILRMAAEYGTTTGRLFRARYESEDGGLPTQGWRDQRWIRFLVVKRALGEFLDGIGNAADAAPLSEPLGTAIDQAQSTPPLNGCATTITPVERIALNRVLQGLRDLESIMGDNEVSDPEGVTPIAQIRSRPPL